MACLGPSFTLRQLQLQETRFDQLLRLLVHPWEPICFMGSHECEFCPEEPLQVSHERNKGSEEPLVTRHVLDGVEIECIQRQTPYLEAYYRRHEIPRDVLVVHFVGNNLF